MTTGKPISGKKETREVMKARLILAKTYIRTQVRRDGSYSAQDLYSLVEEINGSISGKKEFANFGKISGRTALKAFNECSVEGLDIRFISCKCSTRVNEEVEVVEEKGVMMSFIGRVREVLFG